MKKLFIVLSVFLVICGLFSALADASAFMTLGLLGIGMSGIGIAAYNKQ